MTTMQNPSITNARTCKVMMKLTLEKNGERERGNVYR
jgi:hypothetical protein